MRAIMSLLMGCVLITGCGKAAREKTASGANVTSQPTLSEKEMERLQDESMARVIEEELAGWHPTSQEAAEPPAELIDPKLDITGEWFVSRGYDGTSLKIRKASEGYVVDFNTHGCLFRYQLKRHGEYSKGVLVLDRPVKEYFPLTYQKLYAMKIGTSEYLIASAAVDDLEKGLSKDRPPKLLYRLTGKFYLFKRRPS